MARAYLTLAAVAFLLHIAWEKLHIVLYTGYETLEGVLPVFVLATLGDCLYTLAAVAFIGILRGSLVWFMNASRQDYFLLAVMGFCIALMVEYKAAYLDRWDYTELMPIVPLLNVGLSPVLQMTVLLPLSVFCTIRVYNRFFRTT